MITGAPLIVKDMAITGVAGAEYGIRGWLAATDLKTGKEVWRTHTIPMKGEPGGDTWKDSHDAAATGGGSTWVTGTYDPETNTLVWGIGNPGPGLGPRVSSGRQPLHRQHAGARRRHRQDQVALPAHAERPVRL